MEKLWQKKVAIFCQLETFVDKTTFNFQSFNKINDFVTTRYPTTTFYLFYLNLLFCPNDNRMDKAQFN